MNRITLHLQFLLGSMVLARVLTWLLASMLEAGHASVVAGVIPGLLLGHLIFGPAVARVEHTPAGTFAAFVLSIAAFMLSSVGFLVRRKSALGQDRGRADAPVRHHRIRAHPLVRAARTCVEDPAKGRAPRARAGLRSSARIIRSLQAYAGAG